MRGFNQAEVFANGLSEVLQIPVDVSVLKKIKMTESQTKMSRLQRMNNTDDVFHLTNPTLLQGKSILIVDDVMTSGATLESCANVILESAPNVKINFATIAFAKMT